MSKLAEAIKRTTRMEAPHIGFSPTPTKPHSTMLLAALVGASMPADGAPGADVLIVQGTDRAPASNGAGPQPLHGAWLAGAAGAAQAKENGFDFIVFDGDEAPASVLLEEDAGLVMQAPTELPDSLLQALQWMPLDALLVRWEGTLTVRRQLELQRLSGFSRKPLLLFVSDEPAAGELEALREAGVIGIVVDVTQTGGAARVQTLRQTIDGLRPRPRRSRGDSSVVSVSAAMLPVAAEPAAADDDEDDE